MHVNTPLGELVDDAPFIYQQINGQQVEVPGEFQLIDNDTYTFSLAGEYDATVELVIDPVLEWSTYAGGSGRDAGKGIAVETIHEAHGGPFSGTHARYILRCSVVPVSETGLAA